MVYIHRARINPLAYNRYFPIHWDYMGSAEFETGGVAEVFQTLSEAFAQGSPPEWETVDWVNRLGNQDECTVHVLGAERRSAQRTAGKLESYLQGTEMSKEWLSFGDTADDILTNHPLGADIAHHTLACVHKPFLEFLHLALSQGPVTERITDNAEYQMGDSVYWYDLIHHRVRQMQVKGIPEVPGSIVLSDGHKKKVRTWINCVVKAQ